MIKIEKQRSYFVSIISANVKDQWLKKCALRIPRDPWIHFCNGYFEIDLFLNQINNFLLIIEDILQLAMSLFLMTVNDVIRETSIPTKRAKIILIKVKLYTALLRLILVCIRCYLKSVLRLKFLILDTCQSDTLYLREQGSEDPRLFFVPQRVPRTRKFGM